MESIKLVLSGNPISTQSIYRYTCAGKYPRLYMTKKGKALKEQYIWEAKSQYKGELVYYPLEVEVKLFFKDKRVRDIDNFNKLWADSLEGIVYDDDKQIQRLSVSKEHSKENPRIEISISDFKGFDKMKVKS